MPYPPNLSPQPSHAQAPVLSSAWIGTLAQGFSTPRKSTLSPASAHNIKARLMQRIAEQAVDMQVQQVQLENYATQDKIVSIFKDDAWVVLSKKVHVKVLSDDGATLSWLLKLLPGGKLPVHDHQDGAEECMILEGQLRINGEEFVCGDYQIAHPGSVHFEVASEQGALVFLKSPSSRRDSLTPTA